MPSHSPDERRARRRSLAIALGAVLAAAAAFVLPAADAKLPGGSLAWQLLALAAALGGAWRGYRGAARSPAVAGATHRRWVRLLGGWPRSWRSSGWAAWRSSGSSGRDDARLTLGAPSGVLARALPVTWLATAARPDMLVVRRGRAAGRTSARLPAPAPRESAPAARS